MRKWWWLNWKKENIGKKQHQKKSSKNKKFWYLISTNWMIEWMNEWMDASTLFNQTHIAFFFSWLYYWYWSIIDWSIDKFDINDKVSMSLMNKVCVWCSIQTLFILLFNSINNDRQWKKFNTNTHTHMERWWII